MSDPKILPQNFMQEISTSKLLGSPARGAGNRISVRSFPVLHSICPMATLTCYVILGVGIQGLQGPRDGTFQRVHGVGWKCCIGPANCPLPEAPGRFMWLLHNSDPAAEFPHRAFPSPSTGTATKYSPLAPRLTQNLLRETKSRYYIAVPEDDGFRARSGHRNGPPNTARSRRRQQGNCWARGQPFKGR